MLTDLLNIDPRFTIVFIQGLKYVLHCIVISIAVSLAMSVLIWMAKVQQFKTFKQSQKKYGLFKHSIMA